MIHHVAEHINHLIGGCLADNLVGLGCKGSQYITIIILDAGHVLWLHANTLVGEGSIGIHHLFHTHLTWTQTQAHHRVQLPLNTERAHHTYQLLWCEERHQIGGDPVAGFLQTPVEGHHLALVCQVFIAWCPCYAVAVNQCNRVIDRAVAWPHAFIHCQGKEVWFDGRAHLTATCCDHIVLEMAKVWSAHIGFHCTRVCIHRHESTAQEMLVPFDGVHRCHGGVYQAIIGEYAHAYWRIEYFLDIRFAHTLLFQCTVAIGLTHRAIHNAVNLLWCEVFGERSIGFLAFLAEETLLEVLHMFAHRFLGILLHARIDGGIYAKSILIEVVWCAIGLVVFIAETIEWVLFPLAFIYLVL